MEIAFQQARFFKAMSSPKKIDLLVFHAAVVKPRPGAAKWLMEYCANNDRVASWTYAIDSDVVTQSVREEDVAYHASGVNSRSIGIELATYGMPSAEQWADPYHQKMLNLASWLAAGACVRHKIEPFFVDAKGLIEWRRGITTHAEVSNAYKKSDHMDPGPYFPMETFLAKIRSRIDFGNFQI